MDRQISGLVSDWIFHLKNIKNYSIHTIESYKFDVYNFFHHAASNNNSIYKYNNLLAIDHVEIRSWLLARKNLNVSHRSNVRALSALKNFIKYLNKYQGFTNESVISFNLRNNISSIPKPISLENILIMIDCMESRLIWVKKRNRALIMLLYGSGLRISEALNLKVGDISEQKSLKIHGKRHKERMVPLLSNVYSILKEYIEIAPFSNSETDYVFCSTRGQKLSRISLAKYLIDIRKKFGLEKPVSAHALRHSFATHLINKDVDLRDIQILLGHSNITTTEIYTKVETSSLIRGHIKFHPRNE